MENPLPTSVDAPAPAGASPSPAGVAVEIPPVPELNPAATDAERVSTRHREQALGLPAGHLGRLADVATWLAGVQGHSPPRPLARVRALVLAADHEVTEAGMYPWPPDTSTRRAKAALAGGSPLAVLARRDGVGVRVVDVGLRHPLEGDDGGYRVRAGNGRIDRAEALTVAEGEAAFAAGRRLADDEIDAGADLLVPGALGVGADTAAAVVVAALRDAEPIEVLDRGDGSDDARWMLRAAAVRDALRRTRPFAGNPRSVLRVSGGADLMALAGLLVQASLRRTPVLLDGSAVTAAALAAERIAPGASRWWRLASASPDPAAQLAAKALELDPLLDIGVRADDGTGALAAVALVQAAAEAAVDLAAAAAAGAADEGAAGADAMANADVT
ncbi:MAG: nicotinate-nucleotide--dimethylbenzimidazole phosphoribosyltransferase [Frankia sp.]|nr:nicotinate-nucleotide--dimethylbenzimidazole phosphoribosyltransferase [Frankia sp.]